AFAVVDRRQVGEVALDAGREFVRLVVVDDAQARLAPRALPATAGVDPEALSQPRPLSAGYQHDSSREQGDVQPAHAASLAQRRRPERGFRASRPCRAGRPGTARRRAARRRSARAAPTARTRDPSGGRARAATRGARRTLPARTPRPGRRARSSPAPTTAPR